MIGASLVLGEPRDPHRSIIFSERREDFLINKL
ncbi:unnamed protein product [Spirodela intermedia]|uniref:Uncharacterized protein n=1 Tax=Spirodela intermedia TaxID=51605 RepID=A0A7I8LCG7_SPIIN|nr:unnamed protein product [Spirodela intermedia]